MLRLRLVEIGEGGFAGMIIIYLARPRYIGSPPGRWMIAAGIRQVTFLLGLERCQLIVGLLDRGPGVGLILK